MFTNRTKTVAAALTIAAAGIVGGNLAGVGDAAAAPNPTLRIGMEGDHWRAFYTNANGCDLYVNGLFNFSIGSTPSIWIAQTDPIHPGQNAVQVRCPGGVTSPNVYLHASGALGHDPVSDLRTEFSSATAGAFGS